MLVKALCDYYDILAETGQVLPIGYSNVKVHYFTWRLLRTEKLTALSTGR